MPPFRFKQFSVSQDRCALRMGTDAVMLGAAMTIPACYKSEIWNGGLKNAGSGEISSEFYRPTALDIGTGCGVIALMVAQRWSSVRISAIDCDGPSIEDARENFAESPWKNRLEAIECTLQSYRPSGPFDLIFSNPPYFEDSLPNPDERERTARHTSSLSYRDILGFASEYLSDGGQLSLILPTSVEGELLRLASSYSLRPFRLLCISTTAAKKPSRLIAEFRRSDFPLDVREESLVLMEGSFRSEAYQSLVSDFYL